MAVLLCGCEYGYSRSALQAGVTVPLAGGYTSASYATPGAPWPGPYDPWYDYYYGPPYYYGPWWHYPYYPYPYYFGFSYYGSYGHWHGHGPVPPRTFRR